MHNSPFFNPEWQYYCCGRCVLLIVHVLYIVLLPSAKLFPSQIRHICCTDDGQAGFVLHEQDQNATKDLNKPASMIFKPMDLLKQMTSIACGKEHALLLSSSGEVYSLGNGRYDSEGLKLSFQYRSHLTMYCVIKFFGRQLA